MLARLLWALDFAFDADGTEKGTALPDVCDETDAGPWSGGFVSLPRAFGVTFKARAGREGVVRGAYEEAQGAWDEMGLERDVR